MHKKRLTVISLLVLIFLLSTPIAAQEGNPSPTPDPRYGAVEAYHEPEVADEANVGWERIIFYWSELERGGPDDWNIFHAPIPVLDREIEGGRELVGMLHHTPDWATDGVVGAGVPYGLYHPIDDPTNYWAQFVRHTLRRYKDRVHRWIIWNEPDIALEDFGAQWQGTPADYYQLVKVAYLVAHEVDPDVQIHLGGLTYWHNPTYLREFLDAASQDPTAAENGYYFDVVSLHVYFKPETTIDIVNAVRDQLAEHGLEDKPIWINETNAPPYDDPAQAWENPVFEVTQDMQASFLLQEFALALSLDIDRIAVYKWIDEPEPSPGFEPYGLIRHNRETRPAFDAFKVITSHYSDVEAARRFEQSTIQEVVLQRGDQTTRVVWARTPGERRIRIPALADSALLVDQTGAEETIKPKLGGYWLTLESAPCEPGEECMMGGPPLVIVEDAPVNIDNPPQSFVINRPVSKRKVAAVGAAVLVVVGGAVMGIRYLRKRKR